jgi:type IV pilus assembly protein PilM
MYPSGEALVRQIFVKYCQLFGSFWVSSSENERMLKLKSTYPIGLDIGNRHIYAAQVKKSRQGLAIRGLWHRELNGEVEDLPGKSDSLVPLLREISKGRRFRGKKVIVNMPSQHVSSFPIHFQVGEAEGLEEAIVRESGKYVAFPMEEAVIDYPSITSLSSADGNQYGATIIATRRDHIQQYLSMLKQAGLLVEALDSGVCALIRLHHCLHDTADNPVVLCNIGHTQSLLSIVTKDNILAHHHVSWGTQILLRKLLINLEHLGGENNAEILLKKYGLLYEDREKCEDGMDLSEDTEMDNILRAIFQITTPYIEEVIHEFHKIIAYVRSEISNPIFEGIYMYGQATQIRNLDHYIERRLNIQTKLVNPFANPALSDEDILPDTSEGAPFALALGLAMRKVPWL